MADQCGQVSVYYGTKACGWNPRFLHSFELKGLSGREREGKTDKRSTVCVDGSPKIDPLSCRVDQMRTIHGGVFRLINSTLHSVSSKVTGKLVISLQGSSQRSQGVADRYALTLDHPLPLRLQKCRYAFDVSIYFFSNLSAICWSVRPAVS